MATLRSPSHRSHSRTLALLSGAVALWSGLSAGWPGPRWQLWERNLEHQMLLWRGPGRPPSQVVMVPVDDASLQQAAWFHQGGSDLQIPTWAEGLDTLPWPRAAYGAISARLLDAGAAAVAINVVFEGESGRGPADDASLSHLLKGGRGRVALAAEMLEPEDSRGAGALTLVEPETILKAAVGSRGLGLTNTLPQVPGQPLLHPEAYRALLRQRGVNTPRSLSTTVLALAGRRSRQDDGLTGLNVYGPEGSFRRLPAWEVLDPERWRTHPLRRSLQGTIVVVGPLEGDRLATAFGPLTGLELLATATANSLQGDGLTAWPQDAALRALLALSIPLLAALLALRCSRFPWRLTVLAAVLVLQIGAAVLALETRNRWIPLLAPASALLALGMLYGGSAYLLEGRERRRLRHTFERYVAPSVVAEILSDPESARGMLRGRVVEVTVLFSDLKGFTQLTRRRSAAGQSEQHVRQLNVYLGAMVEVITAHGGTIDKFIGDAVMAVFGSPVGRGPTEEAQAAVRCALAMVERLQELNQSWSQQQPLEGEEPLPSEPLANGVGLASGPVVAGQIGSPQRLEFTVIGDTVNLAARLESVTRQVEVPICLDQATAGLIAGCEGIALRSLGPQPVKSLGDVEVFTVCATAAADGRTTGEPEAPSPQNLSH
ncbi:MAG: adenylate/guanylate cyclase domain-containing protein [Cyanobium sp.]